MREIYWKYIALIFIGLNLLLLYNQVSKKNDEGKNKSIVESQNTNSSIDKISFPEIIESDLIQYPKEGVKAIVFFNDNGCRECVSLEVERLNELNENHHDRIDIFLISQDTTYLKRLYSAEFDYENISKVDFRNLQINSVEPFVLVVDKNRYIQQYYFAKRNQYELTNTFYSKLNSLLDSL